MFLSYARQDVERVRKFSADLRRAGIEPWMDDELQLANRWNDEIDGRIAAADFVLLLLSRATRKWVMPTVFSERSGSSPDQRR